MATRFVNDKECTDQNIDPSYLMEWQVFIVNSQSSPQLLIAGKGDTLPPLTIITENKDILFTCNRTFRRLNKAIFIHWGDQRLFDVDYAYMVHQLSEFVCIELEDETEDFIILHPKSEQQLMEIYSELVNNSKYIDKMSYPFTQMEFEVRKHTLLNILEKQVIQCNRTPLSNNKILLLVSQG